MAAASGISDYRRGRGPSFLRFQLLADLSERLEDRRRVPTARVGKGRREEAETAGALGDRDEVGGHVKVDDWRKSGLIGFEIESFAKFSIRNIRQEILREMLCKKLIHFLRTIAEVVLRMRFSPVAGCLRSFCKEENGQDLVEYSLLLVFIALAAVGLLSGVRTTIQGLWTTISNVLANVAAS